MNELAVSVGGLVLSILIAIIGAFRYFSAEINALRREAEQSNDALRKEFTAKLETQEAKWEARLKEAWAQIAALDNKIQEVSQEAIRRRELESLEARIAAQLDRSDRMHTEAFSRAEAARTQLFDRLTTVITNIMTAPPRNT
jgi:predicted Holliday junction resolvase-like endonuclease